MVTYSDLILIGQLIVAILNLFVHIYNNKKKKLPTPTKLSSYFCKYGGSRLPAAPPLVFSIT